MENRNELINLTIPQLLKWRQERSGEKVALREKDFGRWICYTWNDYYTHVRNSALGLAKQGLRKGDVLAIIGDNIPELLFMALGAQSIGAISAALYQTSLPDEIASILSYLDASVVFCDDQEQVDKVLEIKGKIPNVRRIIYEDPRGMRQYKNDDWLMPIEALYRLGEAYGNEKPDLFDEYVQKGKPTDVSHLCLTSGTTGMPKGTMMTHQNYINMGLRITEVDPLLPTDEYVSFLPFAWIGEQMNSFGVAMATGITINYPESVETTMEDLKEIGPHFMFGAPRIYENIRSNIWLKIDESYAFNRWVYQFFMNVGEKVAQYRMIGQKPPLLLNPLALLAKLVIFRPLVNQLGLLRLRRAYTGGAALGPELFTFFQAIGVNLKQIYGQTEITGIAYMHRDGDIRPDTVGKPLPGTECKIAEDGEILSKSLSVSPGYYKLPDKTDELLSNGWLHSGDAGFIDDTGHLVIIDRLSDVMHNQDGAMFSPMYLENKLKFSPYIKEAVVFGDKEAFIAVMINIDPVIVGKWAEDHGISYTTFMDLSGKTEIADLVRKQITKYNQTIEKAHFFIKRFVILYKLLDVDDGELTKTGKIRRKFVREKYADIYEGLYDVSLTRKKVLASFQYQDGQVAEVETELSFYTMET